MRKEELHSMVSEHMDQHLKRKFSHWSPRKLEVATLEFLKFFVMASKLRGYFIPLNEDADAVWHAFILETREYLALCKTISPDFFLHHSGILLHDYAATRHGHKLYEQDLTYLATYVSNFGHFDEEAIEYWPVAMHIKKSMNWDMNQFNAFCTQLVKKSIVVENP
jgi:hypothetical protein